MGVLLNLMHIEGLLEDVVGLGKALFYIAYVGFDEMADIAGGVRARLPCLVRRG